MLRNKNHGRSTEIARWFHLVVGWFDLIGRWDSMISPPLPKRWRWNIWCTQNLKQIQPATKEIQIKLKSNKRKNRVIKNFQATHPYPTNWKRKIVFKSVLGRDMLHLHSGKPTWRLKNKPLENWDSYRETIILGFEIAVFANIPVPPEKVFLSIFWVSNHFRYLKWMSISPNISGT